jgi:ribose transport system permease protein
MAGVVCSHPTPREMKIKFGEYGMVLVLLALGVLFSLLTLTRTDPDGPSAAAGLVKEIGKKVPAGSTVLVFGARNTKFGDFAEMVANGLQSEGQTKVTLVIGEPRDLRRALDQLKAEGGTLGAIATSGPVAIPVIDAVPANYPEFEGFLTMTPKARTKSTFLTSANFMAIVERVVVIAIVAIGMTLVIVTAGIDLSVGSLIGLSAMMGAWVIELRVDRVLAEGGAANDVGGGMVILGFAVALLCCGLIGLFSGALVAFFKVAPFIVTLGIMMIARGLAEMTNGGFTVTNLPATYTWLSHGRILGLPNTVILLILLYAGAHIFMSRTKWGRYIYAVGGNPEAARLSGVPVTAVIVFVYTVCGLMAGLGGHQLAVSVNRAECQVRCIYCAPDRMPLAVGSSEVVVVETVSVPVAESTTFVVTDEVSR